MNCEQKKALIAKVIENRTVERATKAQKKTKNPTRFALLKDGHGNLVCKWSQNLTPYEREQCNQNFITVKQAGYSAEDWDSIVRRFWNIV